MRGAWIRWSVVALFVFAVVIVPFALFEASILEAVNALTGSDTGRLAIALTVALLLASDVFLPIPSSVLATISGLSLGLGTGALVTWAGMQAGALIGYAIGRSAGTGAVAWFVGPAELERAARSHRRWGWFSLVASRAVPVLAESSVLLAGTVRMPMARFAWFTGASNAGVALVYAAVGAYAVEARAFMLAFAASVLLPGAVMLVHRACTGQGEGQREIGREAS